MAALSVMEAKTRDRLHYGIALRIEAVNGRGIVRGRADETAAFGAAVVVVLVFVFGIELSQLALLALTY